MKRRLWGPLSLATLSALLTVACGDPGIEGAWARCEGDCLEIENDGFLLRDDGTAESLEVFDDVAIVHEAGYCVDKSEGAFSWSLEGDQLKVIDERGDEDTVTIVLNEDRLTIIENGSRELFQRLEEDRAAGQCKGGKQPVPVEVDLGG
jgi:hypothetical protein